MAFALAENGQVAHETSCIFEITREAQLTPAPPDWRAYLVRSWGTPARPAEAALPRTDDEVKYWDQQLAEGWAQGERQAVDIFLSDLGRLQRDIVGMARFPGAAAHGPGGRAARGVPVEGGRRRPFTAGDR